MKYSIILVVLILMAFKSFAQDSSIEIVKDSNNYDCVVFISNNKIDVDTLGRYALEVELLDYLVINDSTVSYIIEADFHFGYEKFTKKESKWNWSKTSGILRGNSKFMSFRPPSFVDRKDKTFKIIGDDLVSIIIKGEETIKDCTEFRKEREAREESIRKN